MNIKEIQKESLVIRISPNRRVLGEDAALAAAESITQLLKEKKRSIYYLLQLLHKMNSLLLYKNLTSHGNRFMHFIWMNI